MTNKILTLIGLALTLVGAALLYFYAVPRGEIGGVILYGPLALDTSDGPSDESWKPKADRLIKRSTTLSRSGFALIALGTLLQIVGVVVDASDG